MSAHALLIQEEHPRQVVLLRLNRPDAANALNTELATRLAQTISTLSCRALVLAGAGRNFCAGADLKERKGMTEAQWHAQHTALEAAQQAVLGCPFPVIAAVQGAAFGGGLELALTCDLIYAAPDARFALTETTLGIIPGMGGTQLLPRAVGHARARELIFTGRPFTAPQALEWGMVNSITPPGELETTALATAEAIAANAPLAVSAAKRAIREGAHQPLPEALHTELIHYNSLLSTQDRQEGINAFNEKRKARFSGQ